jgi:hypothetical protein
MNFLLAVLSLVLVVVPQIVYDASGSNGTRHNTNSFNIKDIFVGNVSVTVTVVILFLLSLLPTHIVGYA